MDETLLKALRAQAAPGVIPWKRYEAIKQLGCLGDYETLLQTLQEDDINIRLQSGAGLQRCGPAALPAMVALLTSTRDDDVKRSLLYSFGHMGYWPPEAEPLLKHPHNYTRSAAVFALGKAGQGLDLLQEMARDPDAVVRRSVARALGQLGSHLCYDADPSVRREAVCHTISLAVLLEVLEKDPDCEVKLEAVKALGRIGSPEAYDLLVWFESKIRLWWPSRKWRKRAQRALEFTRGQIRLSVNQPGTDSDSQLG